VQFIIETRSSTVLKYSERALQMKTVQGPKKLTGSQLCWLAGQLATL
jgi:hypothetical protein